MRVAKTQSRPPAQSGSAAPPVRLTVLGRSIHGTMHRINAGLFHLRSSESLPTGTVTDLHVSGCHVRAEVVYSKPDNDGFLLGIRMIHGRADGAQRAEPRFPIHKAGKLLVIGPTIQNQIPVIAIDISRNGLGLDMPVALDVETEVELDFDEGIAFGEIRFCRSLGARFRAGVALVEFLARTAPKQHSRSWFERAAALFQQKK